MNISAISSNAASAAQEAAETASQTQAEAAKGDQQAIRKLARLQAAHATGSEPQPAQAPAAPKGGLNAVA